MTSANVSTRIPELRRAIRQTGKEAYLVEPRVVRRIMRELHGYARLSTRIPHTDVLVVRADDIRSLAHPDELGLEDFLALPAKAVLVAQPEEHELETQPVQELLLLLWSRLFHGCIDLTHRQQVEDGRLTRARVEERINRIGQVEFDEAHSVLRAELRLVDIDSHVEAYCEFAATYLQLSKFSPDLVAVWFPSIAGRTDLESVFSPSVKADALFNECRLYGAVDPDLVSGTARDEERVAFERQSWVNRLAVKPSPASFARLLRRRERWKARGNTVSAAVAAMKAADSGVSGPDRESAVAFAREDMIDLAARLQQALKFSEGDLEEWRQSLWELLQNSTHGFWNSDKRLLYDLQKVCLDHERTTFQVDLVKWIVSRGRRPLSRPLRNLREVMMAKHLAHSAARLVSVRLSGNERARLARLIHEAAELAEDQMRLRMRPAMQNALLNVGLNPQSVPEKVAFDKMIEESLDCITERGYLTMGYLRDAISRNDLKLPDLTHPRELIRGDHLLRTDDRLDVSLDGVYRRGEFYLRWLQVVSSLAFGYHIGRFLTLFIAIPFGGAFVIVIGAHHLVGLITGRHSKSPSTADTAVQSGGENVVGGGESVATDESKGREAANDGLANSVDPEMSSEVDGSVPATNSPLTSSSDVSTSTEVASASDATTVAGAAINSSPENDSSEGNQLSEDSINVAAKPTESVDGEMEELSSAEGAVTASEESVDVEEVLTLTEARAAAQKHHGLPIQDALPPVILVGFLLMALIHLPNFRQVMWNVVRYIWSGVRRVIYDIPLKVLNFPLIQKFWRSRWFVRLRRTLVSPVILALLGCRVVPSILLRPPLDWWWVGAVAVLLSLAMNSRLGRDAEELTAEWLANAWHDLRSRFLVALLDWIIDFFKWLLNLLERFIYAVDEWLRFHSGETKVTIVAKAFLGVIWSFVAFLLRIYVNLLIEPTLHPVKHFPVVTVAHKMFLPVILVIEQQMRRTLTPYLGIALAGPITWFNIVFLPGIFGFLVWELKENWRLYAANRVPTLDPVVIGSHGEDGARLLKPGFHSGTLHKLFSSQRRLERSEASFQRFSQRRAVRESLEHVERDIRRFVERDLI
ncbi:MAG: hypothetical protein KDA81_17475, partial [Planctomycetaceae bacterium]|nr:hypothetical protein [Planctomycetaceae bacterium]